MSTVHYLDGRQGMLDVLARYVALIHAGKIEYLAVVAELGDDNVEFAWSGRANSAPTRRLIGTLEVMKARLIEDHEQSEEVEPCG